MDQERLHILEMISDGSITSEQGAMLIQALDSEGEAGSAEGALPAGEGRVIETTAQDHGAADDSRSEPGSPAAEESSEPAGAEYEDDGFVPPAAPGVWRYFWLLSLAAGVAITSLSGFLVFAGTRGDWNGFWMACVWLPLLLGISVIVFSWSSRTARWVHVRVKTGQDEWPRRIAISLPLPLRTAAWFMRYFGRFIPGLDDVPLPIDEAIMALQQSVRPEDPLYVHVQDSGGEEVQVYIG